ncbi:MAG: class I SAM-dependent methyltransferase [Anaerolineales bacterium]|jgi:ubiquinone/menaquinone biosynthesis C-methylase UbiE
MAAIDRIIYELIYRISKPRWDDGTIPSQVAQLASNKGKTRNAIDLGCGTGTHSIYLSQQGFAVIGVDISPTAVRQAQEKASRAGVEPEFVVHDVTCLDFLPGPFDIALDVGCLHGLSIAGQRRYALELTRLMQPGGTLLVWGVDPRPLGSGLSPDAVETAFKPGFRLERVEPSQLHQRQSKWYWLYRQ